jgi:hypothetical protein
MKAWSILSLLLLVGAIDSASAGTDYSPFFPKTVDFDTKAFEDYAAATRWSQKPDIEHERKAAEIASEDLTLKARVVRAFVRLF